MYKIYQLNPLRNQLHHTYRCPTKKDALKEATRISFAGYRALIICDNFEELFFAQSHHRPTAISAEEALKQVLTEPSTSQNVSFS